jgi:tetratricopeptide (TPR) repeat protein
MVRIIRRAALGLFLLAAARPAVAQKVEVTESLEALEASAARDSNDPAAHYNLAMGYWSKKRYAEAESSLRTATRIDPQFADAYLALSVVRNWDGDYWKQLRKEKGDSGVKSASRVSDSYYRKAFMLDPLVNIKILGGTYRFYSHSRFFRAFEDLVEGKYDKAYETLDKEMKYWGGSGGVDSVPEVVVWLHGLSAARTNQYDAAIHDMENMLHRVQVAAGKKDSTEDVPLIANEYRYLMAAMQQKAGRTDEAIRLYQEVAQNDVGNYMAHVQLARIYEGVKDYPRAVQERTNAINANPDDPSLLLDLGITLGKSGNMAEAATNLQSAVDGNPRDARALFWLGLAQMEQGKKPEAKAIAPSRYDRQIATAKDRLAQLQ